MEEGDEGTARPPVRTQVLPGEYHRHAIDQKDIPMPVSELLPATRRAMQNTRDDVALLLARMDVLSEQNTVLAAQNAELLAGNAALAAQNAAILERLNDVYARVVQTDCGINERLTTEFGIERRQRDTNEEHAATRFMAMYRGTREDHRHARKRLIASMEMPTGTSRLVQRCCARLAGELGRICEEHGLRYLLSWGALVGAECRGDFLPWDDDVDVIMPRDDMERLIDILRDDEDYQVTVCYDWYVLCRQVRFSRRDGFIPSFVDICPFDWSHDGGDTAQASAIMRRIRTKLEAELRCRGDDDDDVLAYLRERKFVYAPGSGSVPQVTDEGDLATQDPDKAKAVSEAFEAAVEKAREEAYAGGVLCDESDADSICYGLDNLSVAGDWLTTRQWTYPMDMMFPSRDVQLCGETLKTPADADGLLDVFYPGWPFLPDAEKIHRVHFDVGSRIDGKIIEAMKQVIG